MHGAKQQNSQFLSKMLNSDQVQNCPNTATVSWGKQLKIPTSCIQREIWKTAAYMHPCADIADLQSRMFQIILIQDGVMNVKNSLKLQNMTESSYILIWTMYSGNLLEKNRNKVLLR